MLEDTSGSYPCDKSALGDKARVESAVKVIQRNMSGLPDFGGVFEFKITHVFGKTAFFQMLWLLNLLLNQRVQVVSKNGTAHFCDYLGNVRIIGVFREWERMVARTGIEPVFQP